MAKNKEMNPGVNQTGAHAKGDVVGHDKYEQHFHAHPAPRGIIEQLLEKLQAEIENNAQVRDTIEALAYFRARSSPDGVIGLEAKLKAGGRSHEILEALEKKELFAKLLDRWALYASAQEIFAFLLAKAEHEFNYFIYPQIPKLSEIEVNQLINDRIVVPVINECGSGVFTINHTVAMGMIYWLAELCFVRWHR